MIKLIVVGKNKKYAENYDYYLTKLHHKFATKIVYINVDNCQDINTKINRESSAILKQLNDRNYQILLDEHGIINDNQQLLKLLNDHQFSITLIIGGAYGVNDEVKKKVNYTLSLSKLVFPYDLCLLILLEQLYRSQMIDSNHPYHHE
jgi:23S rRNA (pseudouridine1915-N3)-methyltransferase